LPAARRTSRPGRWTTVVIVLSAALALQAAPGFGTAPAAATEVSLASLIDQERASAGLGGLATADRLSDLARKHSAEMADQQRLSHHSCLGCTLRGSTWNVAGENVGAGSSIEAVHQEMMRSASHRDNVLRRAYDKVGVGIVRANGMVWVTEIFVG
jgi:uncharacterized protein YkwD